ncbi:hypothetical protein AB1Y20_008518 [Prymnesium parvum]|uniref:DNA-directed DNA polymerase n=1 Tax=Prymnesium parvum TaxID=97485 RepID=A0AB34IQR1_PRYPA
MCFRATPSSTCSGTCSRIAECTRGGCCAACARCAGCAASARSSGRAARSSWTPSRASDVAALFPGLGALALSSFADVSAWPCFVQMRFALDRQCSVCYRARDGGFVHLSTGDGWPVLLYAHDACVREHTVALDCVEARAYYYHTCHTAQGRRAIERLHATSARLLPCLLARPCAGLRRLPTVAYARRAGARSASDACLADRVPNVPREYTLVGALFESEREVHEAVDAFRAWGGVVNRARALREQRRKLKLERAIVARARWMRRATGLTPGELRRQDVLHLLPFSGLLGDAAPLRASDAVRTSVREAARILPEFVRRRDELIRLGAIRSDAVRCVSACTLEWLRAEARKRPAECDAPGSPSKRPRGAGALVECAELLCLDAHTRDERRELVLGIQWTPCVHCGRTRQQRDGTCAKHECATRGVPHAAMDLDTCRRCHAKINVLVAAADVDTARLWELLAQRGSPRAPHVQLHHLYQAARHPGSAWW